MVRPGMHDYYDIDNYPMGTNAVVAVISYTVSFCVGQERITLFDQVCQWQAAGPWFSSGTRVSSNKIYHHYIPEILLNVAFNTINLTNLKSAKALIA
jgi:hypothetical protein